MTTLRLAVARMKHRARKKSYLDADVIMCLGLGGHIELLHLRRNIGRRSAFLRVQEGHPSATIALRRLHKRPQGAAHPHGHRIDIGPRPSSGKRGRGTNVSWRLGGTAVRV